MSKLDTSKLKISYVNVKDLKLCEYNPRKWSAEATAQLTQSLKEHGLIDPIIVNSAPNRKNVIIGGNFRFSTAKNLGMTEIPVVYLNIPDLETEKKINIRLNKAVAEFDWSLLLEFGEDLLKEVGFNSEEMDKIFDIEDNPEVFDLNKELKKLKIDQINVKKGDVYELGNSRLCCGDSTIEADVFRLMDGQKADMCFTDPPYILSYLTGKKRNGKPTEGFGLKRDRKYLETDVLPPDFTEKWMANIAKIQKPDFSIIVYENPKNLRIIWNELEKHWKYRNTIVWHLPNRVQGFSSKYKFFNKHDIALVGSKGNVELNLEKEDELFQTEYETALYATSGRPQFESYEKNKKYCPTDFIEFKAADEKSSGQGIIFGTKPLEILIPYIKVLTKRGDLIVEPFGGSGSTLIASEKMGRRCFIMEKCATYAEVIMKRWENSTGLKRKKII